MGAKKNKDIRISALLKEKHISLDLQETEKKEVLTELVELIAGSKKKILLKSVLEREKLGSTGIGGGVAIPHAKTEAVKNFVLAFGRKNEGVDFGALDGEKTYLFFVFASPKNEVENHLKILAEISRLVKDKFTVELLKKADSKDKVMKIIKEMESRSK